MADPPYIYFCHGLVIYGKGFFSSAQFVQMDIRENTKRGKDKTCGIMDICSKHGTWTVRKLRTKIKLVRETKETNYRYNYRNKV